jgi:hypothetical protein
MCSGVISLEEILAIFQYLCSGIIVEFAQAAPGAKPFVPRRVNGDGIDLITGQTIFGSISAPTLPVKLADTRYPGTNPDMPIGLTGQRMTPAWVAAQIKSLLMLRPKMRSTLV